MEPKLLYWISKKSSGHNQLHKKPEIWRKHAESANALMLWHLSTEIPQSLIGGCLRYYEALENGQKKSLAELGEGLNMWENGIARTLEDVGLEPMYRKREKVTIPDWKNQAIFRAFDLDMTALDIGYFLEVPHYFIAQ